ncbi:MAG: ATP-binding cassette domain-containing protein [Pseudomonadota bacterium]|nr:ATP-binding cassette domain-containing protein [Pseudomonadota bacterium]
MIETHALTKNFGTLVAVERLSFSVRPGEVLGFLGPNGAGKSTTMRMIAGYVSPTSGNIKVGKFDLYEKPIEAKKIIGYLPEGAPTYGEMTTVDFLHFIADIRKLTGSIRKQRLEQVINILHLEKVLEQKIDTLSKGYKRRVGLGQAILHDPQILILDEPTDGLDPNQKHEVRELIRSMSKNKTIIISTHILEEVDAVCDRAMIISNGRLILDETPEKLLKRSKSNNAVIIRLTNIQESETVANAIEKFKYVDKIIKNKDSGEIKIFSKNNKKILQEISVAVTDAGWKLDEIRQDAGRLDEVFREVTKYKSDT